MITGDAVFAAGIHQNSGSFDVGIKENFRVFDGAVYVRLSCEVHYDVRMLFLKETVNGFTVRDAVFYKTEIRLIHDRSERGKIARVGQAVQADDPVIRMSLKHVKNKVASDKSGTAGNNNVHM